jgi:flagellar FliL protein
MSEESLAVEEQAPERGGRRLTLVIGAGLLAFAIAGAAAFLWIGPDGEILPQDAGISELSQPVVPTSLGDATRPGVRNGIDFNAELDVELPDVAAGDEEEGEAAAPSHLGKIFSLEPFVVNIADRDRDRFLKLKTDIELSDDRVSAEMQQRLPQIRDLVISLLGSKSFDEVRTIEGKNFLREEMLLRINALLVTGNAKAIYFTEFVVQ